MNKVLKVLAGLTVVVVVVSIIAYFTTTPQQKSQWAKERAKKDSLQLVAKDSVKNIDAQKVVVEPNWTFEQDTDKMSGKVNYYTHITSVNKIYFKFPYEGGSSFYLTVRKEDNSNDVLLQVSKGQFISSMGDENITVKVKFDSEVPEEYTYTGTTDGSNTTIFIGSVKKFINKLRTAKKLMIEAEFYQEGRKVIEFDVSGFEWKH